MSERQACAAVGIAKTTLHDAIARLADQPDRQKLAEDRLGCAHLTIATQAAEMIYGRLGSLPDDLLLRAYGIASDKVAVYAGWGSRSHDATGSAAGAAEAIARILGTLEGHAVTLSVSRTQEPTLLEHAVNLDQEG